MLIGLAFSSLRLRPLRTLLTALGIAVAVGSMVIFLSLGEGIRQVFGSQLSSAGPDIQVSVGDIATNNPFGSFPELDASNLQRIEAVAEEYAIVRAVPVIFYVRSGLDPTSAVIFQGIPPRTDVAAYLPGFELIEGSWLSEDGAAHPAVIGESVADRMGLSLGRVLRLNPQASFEIVGKATAVGGVVDNSVLVPLEELQDALGLENRISYISLDLAEPGRAGEVAAALGRRFPELTFQTSSELLEVFERALRIGDAVRLGVSAIALLVGAIAVANTLLMSVFERTREFAVLRAIGARPRFLLGLVLAESVLLSLLGAAAGLVLGRFGIEGLNLVSDRLVGVEVAVLTMRLLLFAVGVALIIGVTAGLLPAARAARVPIATAMARE